MKALRVTTAAQCKAACRALAAFYHADLHYGPDLQPAGALCSVLSALGAKDAGAFLSSTAITFERDVYLPFRIGAVSPSFPVQVATVAHECEHVAQAKAAGGALPFWSRYVTNRSHRSQYEAEAYAVTLEVLHALTGQWPDLHELVRHLRLYLFRPTDLIVLEKHLAILSYTMRRGGELARQIGVIRAALEG